MHAQETEKAFTIFSRFRRRLLYCSGEHVVLLASCMGVDPCSLEEDIRTYLTYLPNPQLRLRYLPNLPT